MSKLTKYSIGMFIVHKDYKNNLTLGYTQMGIIEHINISIDKDNKASIVYTVRANNAICEVDVCEHTMLTEAE